MARDVTSRWRVSSQRIGGHPIVRSPASAGSSNSTCRGRHLGSWLHQRASRNLFICSLGISPTSLSIQRESAGREDIVTDIGAIIRLDALFSESIPREIVSRPSLESKACQKKPRSFFLLNDGVGTTRSALASPRSKYATSAERTRSQAHSSFLSTPSTSLHGVRQRFHQSNFKFSPLRETENLQMPRPECFCGEGIWILDAFMGREWNKSLGSQASSSSRCSMRSLSTRNSRPSKFVVGVR
ncbi:hypothetical protein C8F01DRAFT_430925 [Mycena amicta]|nr:hypothetical protein C8F01DRAFT_430925 [Mycena amicta]